MTCIARSHIDGQVNYVADGTWIHEYIFENREVRANGSRCLENVRDNWLFQELS